MKLSIPIFLALILLLVAVSFARAEAASAAGEAAVAADQAALAIDAAPTMKTAPAYLTSTITATSVITPVNLSGVIVYGSGTELSETLPVTLYAYQAGDAAMDLILTTTATTQPGGAFTFENVTAPDVSIFMTSATYAGMPYHSAPSTGEPMTITVYETTTATTHLLADQMHLIFDFSVPDYMQVMEVYILTNVGNQTIMVGSRGQYTLDFPLPEGAQYPDFRSGLVGEAELDTNDGFWDIPAVRPGGFYGVSYFFSLPYTGKITLNQPIELPVSSVSALLPVSGTLKLESAALVDTGPKDFGGVSYNIYTGENLPSGSQLAIQITGSPSASASRATSSVFGSRLGLIIGLGAFGLALILVGAWISLRNRSAAIKIKAETVEGEEPGLDEDETINPADTETLMDDIIALDDLYQAGELPEAAYRERRAELKEKLRAIVGDDDRSS